jgi:hypothetical protein
MHVSVALIGLWLPIAGVTIAYAMLNPDATVLFMFIIPLKLKYLAILDVIFVFVTYGHSNRVLGILALLGCAASYWYVASGRSMSNRSTRGYDFDNVIRIHPRHTRSWNLNPIKMYRDYRERKRLRDLFDESGFGD